MPPPTPTPLCFIRAWFPLCLWELRRTSAMLRPCWSTTCPISRLVHPLCSHFFFCCCHSPSLFFCLFVCLIAFTLNWIPTPVCLSGHLFLRSTDPLCSMRGGGGGGGGGYSWEVLAYTLGGFILVTCLPPAQSHMGKAAETTSFCPYLMCFYK